MFSVIPSKLANEAVTASSLQEFFAPQSLTDIVCFDNFGKYWRFGIIYIFNTYSRSTIRKQFICFTPEGVPIKTLANSVVSANWAEREI